MTTMHDVAREAGVSQASVSFAFNRPERLSPEVRQNILAVAHRLRYPGPHPAAKSLRSGKAGAIGLVVNDELAYAFEDPAVTLMLRGIGLVNDLSSVALTILPFPDAHGSSLAGNGARLILQSHVDGFIFEAFPENHAAHEAALSRALPIVIMGSPRIPDVLSVTIDERSAARLAAEHIIALGHRRIGILVDRVLSDGYKGLVKRSRREKALNSVTALRISGYEDAFNAAGLPFDAAPILEAGGYLRAQADGAAIDLLENHGEITAAIAISDVMAVALLDQAKCRGIEVPRDLSVIGFDDVPIAQSYGLTTIKQPIVERGQIAAQMLVDAIAGREVSSQVLDFSLVQRATTASPGND